MGESILEKPFWRVDDVMKLLDISKPTAYGLMKDSGCLLPIGRKRIVPAETFMKYLKKGVDSHAQTSK